MYIQVLNMMKQTGPVTIPPSPPFPSTFFRFRKLEKSKKWITTRASTGQSALFSCVCVCLYCLSVKNRCAIAPTTSGKSLWLTSSKEEEEKNKNPAGKTKSEGRKGSAWLWNWHERTQRRLWCPEPLRSCSTRRSHVTNQSPALNPSVTLGEIIKCIQAKTEWMNEWGSPVL